MRKQWLVFIVVILASFTLWGCGSSRSSGDSTTPDVPIADAERTGNCTVCHTIDVHTNISGVAGVNLNASGLGSAITHDCEDCHGGGQFHHGTGPIPFPSPDGARCETCHTAQTTPLLGSKHNAGDATNVSMIADGHDTSYCQRCHTAEGSVALKAVYGSKTDITTTIVSHGTTPGAGQVEALQNLDADGNDILHNPVCGACHNALTKALVEVDAGWNPDQVAGSSQFDLCTSCHNYKSADGSKMYGPTDTVSTVEFYHNNTWYRTLPTTHYDDPTTLSGQGTENGTTIINKIEGYVLREASANPCFDCHGHELRANTRYADALDGSSDDKMSTPHNGWAKSAHGGRLLTNVINAVAAVDCTGSPSLNRGKCNEQVDAAIAAYTSDTTGGVAWAHYDWDDTASRGSCQMCHTATGAANYLDDPTTYDPANNDFTHMTGWVSGVSSSPQNEMLYCWGCHSDAAAGTLRNPGAITRPYSVGGTAVVMPDAGNSNVCINCHGARGNAEGYVLSDPSDPLTDMSALAPGFGGGTKNVTNAHYLVAAATLYAADTKIGYEYVGLDYAPKSYFAHDAIGLNGDSPETGDGPCAACHMQTAEKHLFEVVEKSGSGVITALKSTSCVQCHTGGHGAGLVVEDTTTENGLQTAAAAAAFLEEEAEGFHGALSILDAGLVARGLTFAPAYPYFSGASWINEGVFGAAHNFNYLHHEGGAYAHNRFYAKRLLFDSIDWVGNDTLDGTIVIDVTTDPEAAHWFGWDGVTAGPLTATRP